ncbi:tetratricopeptide repeat protein [Arcticibacterium luteifluviistationis]|nr:tetratricopeptide repeat protein [Arcticibacterium luteifluviistationis]
MNIFKKSLLMASFSILATFILACGDKNKTEAAEFFERGNFHFKKNETERALELFTEAIDKVPDFADAYNNRGLCFEKMGNVDKARNDYRKAVELDDSFSQAKLNYAHASLLLGENKEAENLLNQLAPTYTDSSQFFDLRGKFYLQSYNPDNAISDFERSLTLSPNNLETKTNLGYALYLQRDFEKAKKTFLDVLSEEEGFAFALNNLSATYGQIGDWKNALNYSEKAIDAQPNEITFINTHALNLLENGEVEKASEYIGQALKLHPENAYALRNSGILKTKSDNKLSAVNILSKVEATNPEVEFIYYYLGKAQQAAGNNNAACQSFKRGALLNDTRCKAEKCQ